MDVTKFAGGAAYVGGRFVPIAEACIPVTDWGLIRSDAVYDVVHVYQNAFFRLADHLDRFAASMTARRLKPAEGRTEIEAILHRCVALAGLADAFVAMVALRGRPRIAGSRRPEDCVNHFVGYAIPWIDVVPKPVQERGVRLWIASTLRVADAAVDPTVKNYQWNDLTSGVFEANDHGYDTTVLCDADGFVTEGPGFNVFVVSGGKIVTPDRGCLHGITRQSVLELCAAKGIDAKVGPVPRAALEAADEVLITSTAGGVIPITRVGGAILGNDRPGPLSTVLVDAYWKMHAEPRHRTPVRPLEPLEQRYAMTKGNNR